MTGREGASFGNIVPFSGGNRKCRDGSVTPMLIELLLIRVAKPQTELTPLLVELSSEIDGFSIFLT